MNINDAYPSQYLKAYDLQGRAVTVTIESVAVEELGREREQKPVVYFVGKKKGLPLNKTNMRVIAGLAGPETDDWPGVAFVLYPTQTEMAGETRDCIRIKPVPPAKAARLVPPVVVPPVVVADEEVPF
jgi:hypothetical protein